MNTNRYCMCEGDDWVELAKIDYARNPYLINYPDPTLAVSSSLLMILQALHISHHAYHEPHLEVAEEGY